MYKTFNEFNSKTYLLDELSYFGLSESNVVKRREMWVTNGLDASAIKQDDGKYVIY
jgi:hypothetical protein